jgi:hypothetical protein
MIHLSLFQSTGKIDLKILGRMSLPPAVLLLFGNDIGFLPDPALLICFPQLT